MSFDSGLIDFKAGKYEEAAHQFLEITESDEENHKAWNALGICLSKTGKYDDASLCFDNAISLSPDNSTYKKNRARNEKKIQPVKKTKNQPSNTDWIKYVFIFLAVILCYYYTIGLIMEAGKDDPRSIYYQHDKNDSLMQKSSEWVGYEFTGLVCTMIDGRFSRGIILNTIRQNQEYNASDRNNSWIYRFNTKQDFWHQFLI
jgi:tetratricopeptide (TPR) repeat protein